MMNAKKNLLVLFKTSLLDDSAVKRERYWINQVLLATEFPELFCTVHELVDRNRITSDKKKIFKASRHFRLKPFRFLINKN